MAFDDQPVEAEEHRAIVVIGVEMDLEHVQRGLRQGEAGLRAERRGEGTAQQVGDEAGGALGGLQGDIAREAVGDHDIDFAARQLVALGKAIEAHRQVGCLAQHRGGFLELVGALQLLGADVEQLDPGRCDFEHGAGIGGAHDRELDEVLRVAFGVGAKVEHDQVLVAEAGQQRSEGGAVDPRHGAQRELGDGHQRAGVAGRQGGVGMVVLHRVDRHAHRRAARPADRLARLFARGDCLGRVVDGDRAGDRLVARQLGIDQRLVTVKVEQERGILATRGGDPGDDCRRADVASHGVDRDPRAGSHCHGHREIRPRSRGFRGRYSGRRRRTDCAGASVRRSSSIPGSSAPPARDGCDACCASRATFFFWERPCGTLA